MIMIDNFVVNLFGNHRALPLLLPDLSDVVKHGLFLLLLPLLLEHLGRHHGLHLVSVVIFTLIKIFRMILLSSKDLKNYISHLCCVAEDQAPCHHEGTYRHQDDAHNGGDV